MEFREHRNNVKEYYEYFTFFGGDLHTVYSNYLYKPKHVLNHLIHHHNINKDSSLTIWHLNGKQFEAIAYYDNN